LEDYCGWRRRFGLIYMAASTVMDSEFQAMAPRGITVHQTRMRLPAGNVAGLTQMMMSGPLEECTSLLASAPLDLIMFGGSSASFLGGDSTYSNSLEHRMRLHSQGIPVSTSMSAVLRALGALGAKRIAIVTPYTDEVAELGAAFLRSSGFHVSSVSNMGLEDSVSIGNVSLERAYEFARAAPSAGAEAMYISCTNLRTVGMIAALEADLGIPVVTAVQASFWDCLRLTHCPDRLPGFGQLLAR
jgi:maleate isomerase